MAYVCVNGVYIYEECVRVCVCDICECMCICVWGRVSVFTSYECVGVTTSGLAVEGAQSWPQPDLISSSSSLPLPP